MTMELKLDGKKEETIFENGLHVLRKTAAVSGMICADCYKPIDTKLVLDMTYKNIVDRAGMPIHQNYCPTCLKRILRHCMGCDSFYDKRMIRMAEIEIDMSQRVTGLESGVVLSKVGTFCSSCLEREKYQQCERCGSWSKSDKFFSISDMKLCEGCSGHAYGLIRERAGSKKFIDVKKLKPEDTGDVFGVEIEALVKSREVKGKDEMEGLAKAWAHFNITGDGSLPEDGEEYVSVPMPKDKGQEALNSFYQGYAKKFLKVNRTCGLHVHIFYDRSYYTIENLRKILKAYNRLEEFFFSTQPKSRRSNHYCMSLKTVGSLNVPKLMEGKTTDEFAHEFYHSKIDFKSAHLDKYDSKRYYWVNIHSILVRNTIEIRLHSGTISPKKIWLWYNAHRALIKYCLSHSEEDIGKLTPTKYLKDIADADVKAYLESRIRKFNPELYRKDGSLDIPPEHESDSDERAYDKGHIGITPEVRHDESSDGSSDEDEEDSENSEYDYSGVDENGDELE
jgi:hypothetical protein